MGASGKRIVDGAYIQPRPQPQQNLRSMKDGIQKLYYSIGEVSERTGLEAHVLRYWESEFPMLNPRKNRAGRRVYTEEDIRTVERIEVLLRDDKFTIDGARQVLEREQNLPESGDDLDRMKQLRKLLVQLRDQLPAPSENSAGER